MVPVGNTATAVWELSCLIPNFQKKFDEGSPEELSEFYAEVSNIVVDIWCIHLLSNKLQHGTNGAHSDDLSQICACIVDWLNKGNPCPSPLLNTNCCKNRGIMHDITGQLLCPAKFDLDNLV